VAVRHKAAIILNIIANNGEKHYENLYG